jgi:hypothetical protein
MRLSEHDPNYAKTLGDLEDIKYQEDIEWESSFDHPHGSKNWLWAIASQCYDHKDRLPKEEITKAFEKHLADDARFIRESLQPTAILLGILYRVFTSDDPKAEIEQIIREEFVCLNPPEIKTKKEYYDWMINMRESIHLSPRHTAKCIIPVACPAYATQHGYDDKKEFVVPDNVVREEKKAFVVLDNVVRKDNRTFTVLSPPTSHTDSKIDH